MYKKVWQKSKLCKSDAQQPSEGSNGTGNLRLSQAKYKKNGIKIDQTTYFRNDVFGDCKWLDTDNGQETNIDVQITIDDYDMGNYSLKVTHEPHRESQQDNVTDVLHWGDAIDIIKDNNIMGKDLILLKDDNNNFKINVK